MFSDLLCVKTILETEIINQVSSHPYLFLENWKEIINFIGWEIVPQHGAEQQSNLAWLVFENKN